MLYFGRSLCLRGYDTTGVVAVAGKVLGGTLVSNFHHNGQEFIFNIELVKLVLRSNQLAVSLEALAHHQHARRQAIASETNQGLCRDNLA
jgi:hypothetical protein